MAGNENSGRRKIYEEWNKVSAINKLWAKVKAKVDRNEELSEYEEKLVLALLPKTIKTETDITTDGKPLYLPSEILNKYDDSTSIPEGDSEQPEEV
jgi:hypothetical protein